MSNLTIIAQITAANGKAALVQRELEKLIPPTLREPGCLQYALHQDNADAAQFQFVEVWESRELWQQHMQAPHLAAYLAATEGAVDDFAVRELSRIG